MAFGDLVQSKVDSISSPWPSSFSVTLDSTPTEGNLLVACHYTAALGSAGPSGWTEGFALVNTPNTDSGRLAFKVAGSGESTTVTCTSSTGEEHVLAAFEFEGPWNATPLDVTATNGPDTSVSSISTGTTGTTAQNDELAVAMVGGESNQSASAWTN